MITKRPHIELDEERHIYYVDGIEYPSVSEILEPLTAPHYKTISAETLRIAAERGRAIHEACEEIDYGLEPEVPLEYEPYVRAYLDFKRDYKPEYLGIEMALAYKSVLCIDPPPGTMPAGTIDRYATVGKERWIVDLKTTASPTKINYLAYCIQTKLYEMLIVGNSEEKEKPKLKRKILFLKKDGKYRLFDCEEWEAKNGINSYDVVNALLYLNRITRPLVKGEKK